MSKDILNFINGEYVKNASGKTYEKRNPVDNSLIGMVYEAGKPEVDAAVAAAKAALHGPWGKLSVVERCNMLDGLVDEINRRFDDFLQAEIADTGKPAHLASHVECRPERSPHGDPFRHAPPRERLRRPARPRYNDRASRRKDRSPLAIDYHPCRLQPHDLDPVVRLGWSMIDVCRSGNAGRPPAY